MTSSSQIQLNKGKSHLSKAQDEFFQVVRDSRKQLEKNSEFQTDDWNWARDLDDNGIFILGYLLYDYRQKILSFNRLKESVYTLNLLRYKFLPAENNVDPSLLAEFQVIFTLYERLKLEEMSWDACEKYVKEQIKIQNRGN